MTSTLSMTPEQLADLAIANGAAQKPSELRGLLWWMSGRPQPRTVLEIGTLRGGTLAVWCQIAAPDALIVSVDLPCGKWGGGYADADVERLQALAQPGQTLELIRGDSHDPKVFNRVYELLEGRSVDLLFIDGDHSYGGVKADWHDYAPYVADGGLVVLHDVLPHPDVPGCDVDRLWEELKSSHTTIEFADPSDRHPEWGQWGGIGAVIL